MAFENLVHSSNFKPCREVAVRKDFHRHEVIFVHCEILCRNVETPQQSFVLPYTTSASGLCVVHHLFFINRSTDAEQIPVNYSVPSSLGQILYSGKDPAHIVSVSLGGG